MPVSPLEVLRELNPDAVPADQPPEGSNYRPAEMQGIACQFCSKFVYTGIADDEVATGYCGQWEANVRGDHVSDAFADPSPALDENGNEVWDFSDKDSVLGEIFLASSATEERDGFVIKDILRTGQWDEMPTDRGRLKKSLKIVRDGVSNARNGVIALSELVENFKTGVKRVGIPLSDTANDHAVGSNMTKLNTGFVEDLWIEDGEDGISRLKAKMNFTEPDVKDKVLRGTYADVSAGIPLGVVKRGKKFNALLDHVCLTNDPFIDGLGEFVQASDNLDENVEIHHFVLSDGTAVVEEKPTETEDFFFAERVAQIQSALETQFNLSVNYSVEDASPQEAVIRNEMAGMVWRVPYEATEGGVRLAAVKDWITQEEGLKPEPAPERTAPRRQTVEDELAAAQRLRELELSQDHDDRLKEASMPMTLEELDALDLSDEQRAAFQTLLSENSELRSTSRETQCEARIAELSDSGLKERPGALKLYRRIYLSDDGGPAVVLLSDDGSKKERLTALEVLDQFIEAMKGEEGKVLFSDQATKIEGDDPPPPNAEGEVEVPLEERVQGAKTFLGMK